MNLRRFLAVSAAAACFPWNLIYLKSATTCRAGYKKIADQVFPTRPSQLPGLWCMNKWDNVQVVPYEIVREYDDLNDVWQGQRLHNPRRNKWWARAVDGSTVLIITGMSFNDPETLFFKKCST